MNRDDRGVTAVEYALYVFFVGLALVLGVVAVNAALSATFAAVAADPMISGNSQTPAEQTPAEQTPAEETPAEETPAEETPAEETPAEQTPAEETPAEETPAEQTPAEETPAEETPASPPGEVRALTATSASKGALAVTWTEPTADGGAQVLGYDVEVDDRSGKSGCASNFSATDAHTVLTDSVDFAALAGTRYCVRVRAINEAGAGEWAEEGPYEVAPVTAPDAPLDVRTTTEGPGTLVIDWSAATDDGGSPVTGYDIEIDDRSGRSGCSSRFSASSSRSETGLTAAFSGLSGSQYCARVRSVNDMGESDWVVVGPATLAAQAPSAPRDLEVDEVQQTWISLTWDGSSQDDYYVVEYREVGATDWVSFDNGRDDDESAKVTGLAKNTSYEFRVAAVDGAGQGDFSETVTAKTKKKD